MNCTVGVGMIALFGFCNEMAVAQTQVVSAASGKFVSDVYISTLNRQPDPGGWLYWAQILDGNYLTRDTLVGSFLTSPEYSTSPGNCPAAGSYTPGNDFFVHCLYIDALGRAVAADDPGYGYWLGLLNSGRLLRSGEVQSFITGPEFLAHNYAFVTSPVVVTGVGASSAGGAQIFTFHYVNAAGAADIGSGDIVFDNGGSQSCHVEFTASGLLNLVDPSSGYLFTGAFGQNTTITDGSLCSLVLRSSTIVQTGVWSGGTGGYDVTVAVIFGAGAGTGGSINAGGWSVEGWPTADGPVGTWTGSFAFSPPSRTTDESCPKGYSCRVNDGESFSVGSGPCGGSNPCSDNVCSSSDPSNLIITLNNGTVSFTVTAKASSSARGDYLTTCKNHDLNARVQVRVYDATPTISSVEHYYGGGSLFGPYEGMAAIKIRGANLGTCGELSVSRSGVGVDHSAPGKCGTQNVTGWSSDQISAYLNIDPNAGGDYELSVTTTNGGSGDPFYPQPGKTNSNAGTGRFSVVTCPAISVSILPRPVAFNGVSSNVDPGYPYTANLTSAVSGNAQYGAIYAWTTDSPSMVSFDTPSGASTTLHVNRPGRAQIMLRVSLSSPCSQKIGQDSRTVVFSDDVTIVGWLNAGQVSYPSPAPDGPNPTLIQRLNNPVDCAAQIGQWQIAGQSGFDLGGGLLIDSPTDAEYATAFLNIYSANVRPPDSLPDSFVGNDTTFRAYNKVKAYYEVNAGEIDLNSVMPLQTSTKLGRSPEPCTGFQLFAVAAEPHTQNGDRRLEFGSLRQLNHGTLGPEGQAVNAYLNRRDLIGARYTQATPYIWSDLKLDAFGKLVTPAQNGELQIFPQYHIYTDGVLRQTFAQQPFQDFVRKDYTSFYSLP